MQSITFSIDLIIEEYSSYVFKIVDNIIGMSLSYQDKEEIVSDAFYLLWKNSEKINDDIKSYLAAIARNCAYRRLRDMKLTYSIDEAYGIGLNQDIDGLIFIKEKVNALNKEEKDLFWLFYIEGFGVKEIAKKYKKRVGSIKVRLYRLRKKLKEEV